MKKKVNLFYGKQIIFLTLFVLLKNIFAELDSRIVFKIPFYLVNTHIDSFTFDKDNPIYTFRLPFCIKPSEDNIILAFPVEDNIGFSVKSFPINGEAEIIYNSDTDDGLFKNVSELKLDSSASILYILADIDTCSAQSGIYEYSYSGDLLQKHCFKSLRVAGIFLYNDNLITPENIGMEMVSSALVPEKDFYKFFLNPAGSFIYAKRINNILYEKYSYKIYIRDDNFGMINEFDTEMSGTLVRYSLIDDGVIAITYLASIDTFYIYKYDKNLKLLNVNKVSADSSYFEIKQDGSIYFMLVDRQAREFYIKKYKF